MPVRLLIHSTLWYPADPICVYVYVHELVATQTSDICVCPSPCKHQLVFVDCLSWTWQCGGCFIVTSSLIILQQPCSIAASCDVSLFVHTGSPGPFSLLLHYTWPLSQCLPGSISQPGTSADIGSPPIILKLLVFLKINFLMFITKMRRLQTYVGY